MKAVNGGADHWPAVLLNQRNEFIGQCCFAGSVDAIDGYAKWIRASDRNYGGCELREDIRSCYDVFSFNLVFKRQEAWGCMKELCGGEREGGGRDQSAPTASSYARPGLGCASCYDNALDQR